MTKYPHNKLPTSQHHTSPRGYARLLNPELNKGTAFTQAERKLYKLQGLLPAHISTIEEQETRALENLRRKGFDIERFVFLQALMGRNEHLFYRLIINHIDELMPLIYTPTVGQACLEFAHIFRQPRGFYITASDRGHISEILQNWPAKEVSMIVVTDGERILGLGDLGANGMGIPIGKLALYTACAGIHPNQCLPVMLDVGTNNIALRNDSLYLGARHPRLTGKDYDDIVDEFVNAIKALFPRALIQFEDFLTPNAYKLLNRYRHKVLCFNDDIQGTAAVALAGVLASCQISGQRFSQQRILFLGAGSAATGIADLLLVAFKARGLTHDEALKKLWFVDQKGLVVKNRQDLAPHNLPYAHDTKQLNFTDAIKTIKPHVLIGATGSAGAFTQTVIELMAKINPHPVIFALSNPTSRAECTAEQAYRWTQGQAIFASGSPFEKVVFNKKTYQPGQGNNAYVFPGIGLGALAAQAKTISDEMFLVAGETLAQSITKDNLALGSVYPPLKNIRQVSLAIAVAVAKKAWQQNLAQAEKPDNINQTIAEMMYNPDDDNY